MNIIIGMEPMPCPRPRIATIGKFAHAYYPAPYKKWKEEAAKTIKRLFAGRTPYDSAVKVVAVFYVQRPKSSKLEAPKPDIDNYLKSLLDACTAAGVWSDDKHVVSVVAHKRWADEGRIDLSVELEYIK